MTFSLPLTRRSFPLALIYTSVESESDQPIYLCVGNQRIERCSTILSEWCPHQMTRCRERCYRPTQNGRLSAAMHSARCSYAVFYITVGGATSHPAPRAPLQAINVSRSCVYRVARLTRIGPCGIFARLNVKGWLVTNPPSPTRRSSGL